VVPTALSLPRGCATLRGHRDHRRDGRPAGARRSTISLPLTRSKRYTALILVDDMSSMLTTAACTLATSATRDKGAVARQRGAGTQPAAPAVRAQQRNSGLLEPVEGLLAAGYRTTITLYGHGGHSGSTHPSRSNAVEKAAHLVTSLASARLPSGVTSNFRIGPSVSVTGIRGVTASPPSPTCVRVMIDARLTPAFTADDVRALLNGEVTEIDRRYPAPAPARFDELESWPAYRLADDSAVANALLDAAPRHRHPPPQADVCGPSNIGNLLAAHGIDATCGFGVGYRNIHGANESASIVDIPTIYRVYRDSARSLPSLQVSSPLDRGAVIDDSAALRPAASARVCADSDAGDRDSRSDGTVVRLANALYRDARQTSRPAAALSLAPPRPRFGMDRASEASLLHLHHKCSSTHRPPLRAAPSGAGVPLVHSLGEVSMLKTSDRDIPGNCRYLAV
jgi:hypothetical protein